MNYFKGKIILNKKIAPDHYVLAFKAPKAAKAANPGQFFNIRVSDSYEPLLRRPFGAHNIYKDRIEILYKVVGKATRILSAKKPGDLFDVLGPLGHGFEIITLGNRHLVSFPRKRESILNIDSCFRRNDKGLESAILVAGGHGVAPLVALAKRLKAYNLKLTVYIGAKTKKYVVCESDFRKLGAEVRIATDDGSRGYNGLVTELVNKELRALSLRGRRSRPKQSQEIASLPLTSFGVARNDGCIIYACGPMPMLKAVAKLAKQYRVPCQVSLEEHMACGIGTCLGCAVKTRAGYKLVCKDGPVFNSEEIVWQ